jgi:hypothetical protein
VTWSTPFLRSIRAVLYLVAYSSNELISASHVESRIRLTTRPEAGQVA